MVGDCNQACSRQSFFVGLLDMGGWRNQMIAYPMICWIVCCLWLVTFAVYVLCCVSGFQIRLI